MLYKSNILNVKLVRSCIGIKRSHKSTLLGLGLRKIGQVVVLKNDPCIIGMISKVNYLLEVKE